MLTVLERRMGRANRGGRPRADEGERGTRQTRVFEDIGEMISVLVRVLGTSSAQLLDPMVRPDLEALCEKHKAEIEEVRAADLMLEQAQERVRLAEEKAARQAAEKAEKTKKPRGS